MPGAPLWWAGHPGLVSGTLNDTELGVPTVAGEWEIGTKGAGRGFCESLCSSVLDNSLGKEKDTWGHSRFHDYIQWIVNIKSRERLKFPGGIHNMS